MDEVPMLPGWECSAAEGAGKPAPCEARYADAWYVRNMTCMIGPDKACSWLAGWWAGWLAGCFWGMQGRVAAAAAAAAAAAG
jgi:hypothetical protein